MNYWMRVTPAGNSSLPIWTIYSEAAILAEYWSDWSKDMRQMNVEADMWADEDVTQESCIEEWVVINWATPVTLDTLAEILAAPKV